VPHILFYRAFLFKQNFARRAGVNARDRDAAPTAITLVMQRIS
jgi:hypothetical protein